MENCSCVFDLAKEKTDFEQKKKKKTCKNKGLLYVMTN